MKLDKETLMKEHFWFLLILVLPLALVSLVLLLVTSSDLIAAPEKKIKDTKGKLEGIGDVSKAKSPKWVEALDKVGTQVEGQKSKIWAQAWKEQERLMTWPAAFPKPVQEQLTGMYFGDDINSEIRSNYSTFIANSKNSPYKNQILDIIDVAQPRNELEQVTVQFGGKDNRWEEVLRWVKEWRTSKPTTEEMWLAQEDVWIQRGLLQIVRDTNDAAARFQADEGQGRHKVFRNADWLLDLTLAEDKGKPVLKTKLTNVGSRRENLGFTFRVSFAGSSVAEMLPVDGEPLAPGKSIAFDWKIAKAGRPTGLEEVRQVFDWRTVPVKRIERIELGYLSHRQASLELKPAKVFDKTDPNAANAQANPAATSRGDDPASVAGKAGQPNAANDVTENGLVRRRYIDTTEQVRRMPVGMVLIVDQAHVQDVLTATANSPLRMQITQFHWRRFHGDIKPLEEQATAPGTSPGTSPAEGERRRPVAGDGPARPPAYTTGPRPAFPSAMPFNPLSPTGAPAQAEDQEWDLVELSLYGVASLYERYPPKEPKPADGTNNPATPTPAPAAPMK